MIFGKFMPPLKKMMKKLLKGDQEAVKEIKELKNLTPNEILTRLPVLLVHIKTCK